MQPLHGWVSIQALLESGSSCIAIWYLRLRAHTGLGSHGKGLLSGANRAGIQMWSLTRSLAEEAPTPRVPEYWVAICTYTCQGCEAGEKLKMQRLAAPQQLSTRHERACSSLRGTLARDVPSRAMHSAKRPFKALGLQIGCRRPDVFSALSAWEPEHKSRSVQEQAGSAAVSGASLLWIRLD